MMARIAYFAIVLPISYLPLPVLYFFTDIIYILFITVAPYRKKVIDQNIRKSFPEKSIKECNRIRRKFYRHFTDLLAEGVKNLSISKKSLERRIKVVNPEIMQELYDERKSALLVSGHYNNWELLISAQNFLFPHQAYGIGKKLTSKFWDTKVNERRSRFGMKVVHNKNYKEELTSDQQTPKAVLVLTDQSPGSSIRSYWMNFLNQKTAVLFGAEMIAHELDYAVVFFTTKKVKRGRYEIELELITKEPRTMEWGKITEAHVKRLENAIKLSPEFWLWSHKRWKRELPEDIEKLREEQYEKFNQRFGY